LPCHIEERMKQVRIRFGFGPTCSSMYCPTIIKRTTKHTVPLLLLPLSRLLASTVCLQCFLTSQHTVLLLLLPLSRLLASTVCL
jgi:hypothetical protein